jgi:predicted SnoaL-like aldol condensation-catalyzing enzyme
MCVIGEAVLFTGRTVLFVSMTAVLLVPVSASAQSEEVNKALARRFYEEVWFSRNPAAVDELVAPEYVIHDIGDQKAAREPASEHKRIAEVFWHNGEMSGRIDFQIAEGDLVATRWQWDYRPRSLLMRLTMIGGRNPIPIINVFRFKDGKIVEFWNHRHDIDIGFASNLVRLQGFAGGMLSSLLVAFAARIWRRRRSRTNRSVDA